MVGTISFIIAKNFRSGLRPLVLDDEQMKKGNCHNTIGEIKKNIDTKFLSRSHVMETSDSNLVSMMGGKWTIYRTMGEESVSKALEIMESQNLMDKDIVQKMKSLQSGNLR